MDHTEAKRSQALEKYLLRELSPAASEEFELHFFNCSECAEDLQKAHTVAEGGTQAESDIKSRLSSLLAACHRTTRGTINMDNAEGVSGAASTMDRCDGCGAPTSSGDLHRIGDGSLRVCDSCYPEATQFVSIYGH